MKYILAIDQSTSATKSMIFDNKANLVKRVSINHKQYYPNPGFVEHDPDEIFGNTIAGIEQLLKETRIQKQNIASISITNQRETSMIWNRHTGAPVCNAAVWQCQRGVDICEDLKKSGHGKSIKEKTGLIVDSYFSASKLKWMMENVAGIQKKAANGDLLLGTMDSWLLWKLTGGKVHATDYSNACRTMLFNINTLQWDDELISLFGLNKNMFPEVRFSDEIFGHVSDQFGSIAGLPISGLIGDSHGALFGQQCFAPGMAKATYGTGSSIMMNIGKNPKTAPEGLVTSIGFSRAKSIDYVFEGNIHCTGDTVNWLVNDLKLIDSPKETEPLATSVKDNGGVYFVPAFVGLGAPYWDHDARAGIVGMGRNASKAHIVRAALESIAYQVKDLVDLMAEKSGVGLHELRVDGGVTRNDFLMRLQSALLGKNVQRSAIEEISALGSAFMAGLATGVWKNLDEIKKIRISEKSFADKMDDKEINRLYDGWKQAVKRIRLK
jgi:glycerol kinase